MITRILRAGLTAKDENTTEAAICGARECQLPTLLETTKSWIIDLKAAVSSPMSARRNECQASRMEWGCKVLTKVVYVMTMAKRGSKARTYKVRRSSMRPMQKKHRVNLYSCQPAIDKAKHLFFNQPKLMLSPLEYLVPDFRLPCKEFNHSLHVQVYSDSLECWYEISWNTVHTLGH